MGTTKQAWDDCKITHPVEIPDNGLRRSRISAASHYLLTLIHASIQDTYHHGDDHLSTARHFRIESEQQGETLNLFYGKDDADMKGQEQSLVRTRLSGKMFVRESWRLNAGRRRLIEIDHMHEVDFKKRASASSSSIFWVYFLHASMGHNVLASRLLRSARRERRTEWLRYGPEEGLSDTERKKEQLAASVRAYDLVVPNLGSTVLEVEGDSTRTRIISKLHRQTERCTKIVTSRAESLRFEHSTMGTRLQSYCSSTLCLMAIHEPIKRKNDETVRLTEKAKLVFSNVCISN